MSVAGLWTAIIGALVKTTPGLQPITGDNNARRTLASICARLDARRSLSWCSPRAGCPISWCVALALVSAEASHKDLLLTRVRRETGKE